MSYTAGNPIQTQALLQPFVQTERHAGEGRKIHLLFSLRPPLSRLKSEDKFSWKSISHSENPIQFQSVCLPPGEVKDNSYVWARGSLWRLDAGMTLPLGRWPSLC